MDFEVKSAVAELVSGINEFKNEQHAKVEQLRKSLDDAHAEIEKLNATGGGYERRSAAPWLDVKAIATSPDPSGGYLVPAQQWGSFIDRLRPATVLLASGVPTIRTESQSLLLPKVTGDPTATWRGELETLSGAGDGSYGLVRATPRKVAAYVIASREVLDDSTPDVSRVLERQISASLGLALDAAAFAAPGVNAGAAPIPLKDWPGITPLPIDNNGKVPADFDWFHAAFAAYLEANGNPDTAALYMAPRTWSSLMEIPIETGSNVPALFNRTSLADGPKRSIFGTPVYISSQIPTDETQGSSIGNTSSAYLVDTSQLAVVVRQDARVELDRSRHFDQDAVGIRGTMRADIIVMNEATVVHIGGFKVS